VLFQFLCVFLHWVWRFSVFELLAFEDFFSALFSLQKTSCVESETVDAFWFCDQEVDIYIQS
jgi:hypothetical protein